MRYIPSILSKAVTKPMLLIGLVIVALGLIAFQATLNSKATRTQTISKLLEDEKYTQALPLIKKEVNDDINNTLARLQMADTALAAKQYKVAEDAYLNILVSDPNNYKALTGLATAIRSIKPKDPKYSNAEELFKQAIKAGPGYAPAYVNYADYLIDAKKTNEARVVVNEGLKYNTDSQELLDLQKKLRSAE